MPPDTVIAARDLAKTFALGFFRKKIRAVRGVSFEVGRGEIFGFLGPNGAGKTTTIKMMMGLIFPSAGTVELLGRRVPSVEAKRRIGYLPESPYFYDYLTGEELLHLAGRLFDVPAKQRRERTDFLLERVGLERARKLPLRKYSKGMLQRIGLAQALVGDPELVVLDEPMSGLDPIGRKEIRDLIVSLKAEGRTVFFSTHILPDAELICDRCAIVVGGTLRDVGPLDALLNPRLLHTEIVLERATGKEETRLPPGDDVEAFIRQWRPDVVNLQYQAAAYQMHGAINLLPSQLAKHTRTVVTFHDLRVPYLFPKAGPLRWQAVLHMARSVHHVIVTNAEDEATLHKDWVGFAVAVDEGRETVGIDEWLTSAMPELVAVPPPPATDAAPWRPVGRGARLLPHDAGTDGMFLAVLRKRA